MLDSRITVAADIPTNLMELLVNLVATVDFHETLSAPTRTPESSATLARGAINCRGKLARESTLRPASAQSINALINRIWSSD